MIEVHIHHDNSLVYFSYERYSIPMSSRRVEVDEWLEANCSHPYRIETWTTPFNDKDGRNFFRALGHIFMFEDANEAMLFKLTWG